MNKQGIPAVPEENRIQELLAKIQPAPSEGFHQKMKQAAWRTENVGSQAKSASNHRTRLMLAMTVLLLIIGLMITPQGRAWAQEVFQFFMRVNSTTIPLSDEEKEGMFVTPEQHELPLAKVLAPTITPEMAGLPECQRPQDALSYACQIVYAESRLGFDLKEFPVQPEGWVLEALNFDVMSKTAYLRYKLDIHGNSSSQLLFIQSLGDQRTFSSFPWTAVPADQVEVVRVGPHTGEYVKGGFNLSNDDSKLIWNALDGRQRLAWSDGTRWYLIELFANTPGEKSLGREQLIGLAAGLVDGPSKTVESLNPDFLYSISDAEKLSGLDLKAPALLPLGVDFSSAQVLSNSHKVILRYGIADELVIHEWEAPPANFEDPSPGSNLDYEIVQVNGRNALYSFTGGNTWFLWWSEGDLNYQLYYYQYLSPDGGILSKEKMIAIAESMSDINPFRGNPFKPYEYVALYEQALGFDVKEFQTIPVGWSFSNVSAFARPACISISYTAEKETGWLSLRQCNSDRDIYFDPSTIPSNAIERVKIRESEGQYIVGNREFQEFGKIVWNPNLPVRTLRWQEDGLWMQITLSGDSALLYDQDDLILYAQSLH